MFASRYESLDLQKARRQSSSKEPEQFCWEPTRHTSCSRFQFPASIHARMAQRFAMHLSEMDEPKLQHRQRLLPPLAYRASADSHPGTESLPRRAHGLYWKRHCIRSPELPGFSRCLHSCMPHEIPRAESEKSLGHVPSSSAGGIRFRRILLRELRASNFHRRTIWNARDM